MYMFGSGNSGSHRDNLHEDGEGLWNGVLEKERFEL
jgi:hypothetical protein